MTGSMRSLAFVFALAVVVAVACSRADREPAAADEVSATAPALRFEMLEPAETGLEVTMTSGAGPSSQIIEVNGGGLGLIDFDRDGDLDLFVANGATMADPEHGPGSRLYENLGAMDFADVTSRVGIDLHRWAMGVAVGDYDGDGWDDLYVTCYGPNVLLRNVEGRFVDVTAQAGVGDPRWGTTSAFGDLDRDGDLDLYVVHYVRHDAEFACQDKAGRREYCGPQVYRGEPDCLYRNQGDGTFEDVTRDAGIVLPAGGERDGCRL